MRFLRALLRPPILNLGLFLLTVLTTSSSYYLMFGAGEGGSRLAHACMFSLSLVAILGAHEMGHYLLARAHRVDSTLPYFIPVPPGVGIGTFGAVIRLRGRIPHKNALVDIGAAGPLAGLLVALPVLVVGYANSEVVDAVASQGFPGKYSLWALGREFLSGGAPEVEPRALSWLFGDNLFTLAIQKLMVGKLPPGKDVLAHPFVVSGWFGLLVTMLNLIPIGQLDGGHLTHALFGHRARTLGKVAALGMVALVVLFSAGWMVWLLVTSLVVGFRHPEVESPDLPLSPGRKLVCLLCFLALVGCVMPAPVTLVPLP